MFWGSKKKCQLEFIGMQEKTALLCHGNVTILAMSCLDFEGLFFSKDFFFFNLDHFKSLYEFVIILLLYYVLVFWLAGMGDLSSLTRDQTCTPALR